MILQQKNELQGTTPPPYYTIVSQL